MISQPLATLVLIVSGGVFCLAAGEKLKIPVIIFLLLFGILFGPDFLNLVRPAALEDLFSPVISLLMALVLFEGGASLKFSQYREISLPLRGLLTIGAAVTFLVSASAASLLTAMTLPQAALFGAVMIVTGPTVVTPILQRIHVRPHLHNLLRWEAILIDPLGVILSVVVFELFLIQGIGYLEGLGLFGLRILVGCLLGLAAGWIMGQALARARLLRYESEELGGLFLLGTTLLFFGIAETLVPHSGLITAAIAGILIGNKAIASGTQVFHFERQVTLFALSALFILISSSIRVSSLLIHLKEGLLVLAVLIFVGRPLTVYLSASRDSSLHFYDKLFLASLAPKGIVSASLAALFAFSLADKQGTSLGIFLPITFIVIVGTIAFYSVFPMMTGRHPSVKEPPRHGVLIVGANAFALRFARELEARDVPVIFVDTNQKFCLRARKQGFDAREGSATEPDFLQAQGLKGVGFALALTPNHELNVLASQTLSKFLGRNAVFRLWDKSDSWDAAASPASDPAWGRPLIGSFEEPYVALWEQAWRGLDPRGKDKTLPFLRSKTFSPGWQVKTTKLEAPLVVKPDNLSRMGIHFPLFAKNKDRLYFPAPEEEIPKEAEIFHAMPRHGSGS